MKLSRSQILTDVRRALEVYLPDRCEQLMQNLEWLIPESDENPRMAFFVGPEDTDQETLHRIADMCEAMMSDSPPAFYVLPPGWKISWTFAPTSVNISPTVWEAGPLNRHAIPQQNREVRGTRFGQVVIDEAREVADSPRPNPILSGDAGDFMPYMQVPRPWCGRFENCDRSSVQGPHHDVRCPLWTAGSGG